jgi:neuronal calcium sensor 1
MHLGAFSFYDLDGDGRIGREELMVVVSAIYRMILNGTSLVREQSNDNDMQENGLVIAVTPEERVEQILNELDSDGDGFITLEGFKKGTHAEPSILQGLLLYDGLV